MSADEGVWTRIGPAIDSAIRTLVGEEAEPAKPKAYPLGILFVHGMGEQARGDTITEMGDALTEWLRRWLGNDRFGLQDATLRSRDGTAAGTTSPSSSGRANATVVLKHRKGVDDPGQKWLLAESWWADAFRPATFGELAMWAIGVGPWLIASQAAGLRHRLGGPNRSVPGRLVDRAIFFLLVTVAAIVAAVIAPLVIVLLLFSLVPIPGVSGFVQGLARNLAGSFGDLLVFVRSPVRFAAMAERVREDIEWLDSNCDRMMVVAHSQGSAVAWHAIRRTAQRREPDRARIALFVTFGQAFRKLKSLHRLHTRVGGSRQVEFALLAAASTASLLIAGMSGYVAAGLFVGAEGEVGTLFDHGWLALILALVGLLIVWGIQARLSKIAGANDGKAQELILEDVAEVQASLPGFEWVDLWASADPAPNGPIFSEHVDGVASYRVRNLASTIFDHSAYWSNVSEFVSAIAFAAGSLTPSSPLGSVRVPARLREAAGIRDTRVAMLAGARVAMAAAFVATLIGLRKVLPALGDAVLEPLGWVPLLPDRLKDWPAAARGTVGALVITVIALAVWWLLLVGWNAVIRADESRFFGRLAQERGTRPARGWAVLAWVIPSAALAWLSVSRADWTFVGLYIGIALLGLVVVLRLMRTKERRLTDPEQANAGLTVRD